MPEQVMSREKALEFKALGNTEFQAGNFAEGIEHFSKAIEQDPTDHVFFSNRSACYASLNKFEEAYEDGKKCVELKSDWAKGYSRKGHAEFFLGKYDEAKATYEAGLKLAPEDKALVEGMAKVQQALAPKPSMDQNTLNGLLKAMQTNPKVAEYMKDPEFMQTFSQILQMQSGQAQPDPTLIQKLQTDPRLLETFTAMMGQNAPEEQEPFKPAPEAKKPKVEKAPEPPKDDRTEEQKAADPFKEEGNKLYKAKQFEEAVAQYDKAIEACPNDIIYYNNKAAVLVEQQKYDECEKLCKDVLEKRYDMNRELPGGGSFEKVAKVYNRLASLYTKQKKYDDAKLMYEKALAEDNNRHTRNALRDLERIAEKAAVDAYCDPAMAEEHKEKGNALFKEQKWAEANKEYDEAIKRNPKDAKLYSNRAATFQKLLAHPDALKDLEKALEIDPKFVKAHSRKGTSHFFMKDYNKALAAYEAGLKIDPKDEGCMQGKNEVARKIQSTMGGAGGPVDEKQVQEAMKDPEIQKILRDPQINILMQQMQENPRAAQEILQKDAQMAAAFQKLVLAGIVRVG